MVISRTPLRMSFVGGGTDFPGFYREHGGAVVSTALDKYVYVTVNKKFDDGIRIAYSSNEEVGCVDDINHPLVRATMKFLGLQGGLEITTIADIPSQGTGLASSSAFEVGLINALGAYTGRYVSAEALGRESCQVEIDICGEPIGKQDQYAVAYGGFNFIEFRPDDSVVVSPIVALPKTLQTLRANTLMFYTGITRSASQLLKQQSEAIASEKAKRDTLVRMAGLAHVLRDELQQNNTDSLGEILHENWELKKTLTKGISNPAIDAWYNLARQAGATGGKLLGAGAGGFLMIYAPSERHAQIKETLNMLRPIGFEFEPLGSRIIFYH